ncbi:hypothetical protein K474DRAFT_1608543, partial [Panus rudis PR-1116 ss-1]
LPDRYRELLRIGRQWRNIRALQKAGFAHKADAEVSQGALALFCAACPQPGINLPADYSQDPDQWKYKRVLVADGNFKQENLSMKRPEDDVSLSDGHGYMVTRKPYHDYLKSHPPASAEVRACRSI